MTCKGVGDKNFCKYSKLFPGWWNRESDCFKSLCWISLGWKFSLKPSKKRASFLLLFEVVSSSSHTRHNVLGWCVAWDFLTRWKQMMSCETVWELEFHFRSPNKLPLPAPPFLPPSPQQVRGVFFFSFLPLLRAVQLCKTSGPSFSLNHNGWSAIRRFFVLSSSFNLLNRAIKLTAKWTPMPRSIHSTGHSRNPLRWDILSHPLSCCLGGF